jgi:HK97 gp10 family phage protein
VKIDMKLQGLDGVLESLKKLPPEVVSKNGGPVRKALRKGAMVIVKQARTNFNAAVQQVGKSGITDTTGFTEKQIIAKRGKIKGGTKGERQVVTVRGVPHPGGNTFRGRPIKANDIAFLMEAGTSKQPATPWMRPAFAAKAPEAISTVTTELPKEIGKVARKLGLKTQGL